MGYRNLTHSIHMVNSSRTRTKCSLMWTNKEGRRDRLPSLTSQRRANQPGAILCPRHNLPLSCLSNLFRTCPHLHNHKPTLCKVHLNSSCRLRLRHNSKKCPISLFHPKKRRGPRPRSRNQGRIIWWTNRVSHSF